MMMNARTAYMEASVQTADPSRLLVMLCDRLVLDVQRGLAAQQDRVTARSPTTSWSTRRPSSPSCAPA